MLLVLWCDWWRVEVKDQVYIHQPIKVIGPEAKVEVHRKPCFTDCICTPQGRAAAIYSRRVYWLFSPIDLCDSQCFAVQFVRLSSSLRSCYCSSCHLNFTNTHGKLDSRMKEFADYAQGRNLKSYWEHRKRMKKKSWSSLLLWDIP